MKNKESTFEIISTDDGSSSFYSKLFDENGHSTTGAKIETITHYIKGCDLYHKLTLHNPLTILEVGFGIGVGFETTISELGADSPLHFLSLEIDENLLHYQKENPFYQDMIQDELFGIHVYKMKKDNVHLTVFIGDARKNIKSIKQHFKCHAIFQDAFSPKRNPMLWTHEWFNDLKDMSYPDTIMSTYSSSSSIRKSMIHAGWKIRKGEKFGPKRSSTRAHLIGETDRDIWEHLQRSPAITLSDSNAANYKLETK